MFFISEMRLQEGEGRFPHLFEMGWASGLREGGQTAGPSAAVVRAANDLRSG